MIDWVYVNSQKISRIGYNSKILTMYIDFQGSNLDTPYTGVSEALFKSFCNAKDIDLYFDQYIKVVCKKVVLDTDSALNFKI